MKKYFKVLIFTLVLSFNSFINTSANANELNPPIIIDGEFEDWNGTPFIIDIAGDGVNPHEDLKEVKYLTDDKYLYLYLERYPVESSYKNQGLWDMWIPILNGNGNGAHNCFLPWDRKDGEVWYAKSVSTFKLTTSFVEVWDQKTQSMVKEFRVRVSLNGQSIGEDRAFRNSDGSKFEIRLPLEKVGLTGQDEVIFSVASDISAQNEKIDWIKDDGPIYSTEGPIFGKLTFLISLGLMLWVGMKQFKI